MGGERSGSDAGGDTHAGADSAEVVLIAAVAENGVIGDDGGMPWHYPADLRRFKELTTGHPVVLGRRTYESIVADLDGPLPGRTNVVLSTRDLDLPEGAVLAGSVEAALDAATDAPGGETVYVAGGATVYEQFLPMADRLLLTEIPEWPDGDTRFPEWSREVWTETSREKEDELAFVTYERV
ncbi:MAG: dihydrofolate reductase [Haloarculaceae archaeon]